MASKFECEKCGKKFDSKLEAIKHEKNCGEGLEEWVCETCGKTFDTKKECEKHEENCLGVKGKHICASCGKSMGFFERNIYEGKEFCSISCKSKYKDSQKFVDRNGQTPIIEFKGRNGRVELYESFVRLDRGTAMGFLMQGLKGKKDIYFKNITSMQIKKPGFSVGYLQFSIPGGNESMRGVTDAVNDENTIAFAGIKEYEKALEIKAYIEKKANAPSTSSAISSAEEIEKLHNLMKKGIITKKEFEDKKKKLL